MAGIIRGKTIIGKRPVSYYYVGGDFTTYDTVNSCPYFARLKSNGTYDDSFVMGTGFDNSPVAIGLQLDSKIVVGGSFLTYDSNTVNRIVRLNFDGSIDSSFDMGGGFNNTVFAIAIQNDGKILVGGSFSTYSGSSYNQLIRLNTDASIDTSFSIGAGFNSNVLTIAIQLDGKILVGGDFTDYDGSSANRIIRLNSDGSIDNSFAKGSAFDNKVSSIIVDSNNKILCVGRFTTYDGDSSKYIIRLKNDGGIDSSTFNIGTSFDTGGYPFKLVYNGKITTIGLFTEYKGNTIKYITRINNDGGFDDSFITNTNGGLNATPQTIELDYDKILVGGTFTSYEGVSSNYIIKLNPNGSIDTGFNIGSGFNQKVEVIKKYTT